MPVGVESATAHDVAPGREQQLREVSLDAFWMPFTPNRAFKAAPRIVTGAHDMYVVNERGDDVVDAAAGLWCVNLGHGRVEIADAVHNALLSLDFAPTF